MQDQITVIRDKLLVRAPAKINLSLLIAGKRPDGFHEIETVMAKVNWYDEILIKKNSKKGIELTCQGPYWAPDGKENLVYQACELLLKKADLNADLCINLTKNIPAGSGLGSASSDAAAALVGLNRFLNLNLNKEDLQQLAASLGSDVTFFLNGPIAFCTGKGEKVENLNKKFDFLAILVIPEISVSTKMVYNDYNHNEGAYKSLSAQVNGYIHKNRIDLIAKVCANMLQTACFCLHRGIAEIKDNVESIGMKPLCLSGSGSVLYYIVPDKDSKLARKYQKELDEIGCKSILVSNNRW